MKDHADQFVGSLFRVLAEDGYTDAQTALLDAYRSEAAASREELAERLLSESTYILERHLETGAEIDVLTQAVERVLERFSTIVETVPIAVLVVDDTGRIDLWNEGAEAMFGWTEDEIRGQPYHELQESATTDSVLEQVYKEGKLDGIETRHIHKNGSVLDVRVWAAPLHERDGIFEGTIVVVSDVTEQKQRKQRLTVLNRVLRHNIQNNVNIIQGHLDLLTEDVSDGNDHVRIIKDYLDDIVALSRTAREMEQLRKPGSDELSVINLGSTVRERIDRIRKEYNGVEVTATVPESTEVVAHDLFPYALDNVLDNAIEHNDSDRPKVVVDVTEDADSRGRTKIAVSDNGPGLPEVEREVLTAETETQLTHSGGTGLWITRWVVRSSNGTLSAGRSQLGGTRITMHLPISVA